MADQYRLFYPAQTGKATPGMMSGSRGIVCGLEFEATSDGDGHPLFNAVLLKWVHETRITEDIASTFFHIFLDGELIGYTVDTTRFLIYDLRGGVPVSVDVLALSAAEHDIWTGTPTLFDVIPTGNRVKLEFVEIDLSDPDNADFSHRLLLSDNGREDENPDTPLATIHGADTLVYTTDILEEQQYSFAIKHVDLLGNIGDLGAVATITVDTYPKQPTSEAISYNQGTRKVTITGTVPAGQAADVVGYPVFWNQIPGFDLLGGLCAEEWAMLSLEQPIGDALSYEIPGELFEGDWLFAMPAMDGTGHMSDYTLHSLSLVLDGSDLEEVALRPVAPIKIRATPNAGGTITVTCEHDGTNATHIRFYLDGAQDNDQAVGASSIYTYTTAALTHNQAYEFKAVARNGTVLSEFSDTVAATADDTGPGGDLTITASLVY